MEWMTWSSWHYCSAERWRDLKECISICQLSPPFAPSFTQPRQVNGPSGCSKTHSTKPTAESSPGCITLAPYWLFCSQTTGWFEWVDGFSLTTGKRVSVSPDKGWTWRDVEHFLWLEGVVLRVYPYLDQIGLMYSGWGEHCDLLSGAPRLPRTCRREKEGTVLCRKI